MNKIILGTIVTLLCSCNLLKRSTERVPTIEDLVKDQWILQSLNGKAAEASDFVKGLPNLSFNNDGALEGSTGCNSFSGKYTIANEVSLKPRAISKMNCPGDSEKYFLDAISRTDEIKLLEDKLVLFDDNTELLKFVAQSLQK